MLIYTSKDSLYFGINNSDQIKLYGYIITFLATIYLLSKAGFARTINKVRGLLLPISLLVLLTAIVNSDTSIKYSYELMLLLLCGAIAVCTNFSILKVVFTDVIYLISVCSLVVFFVSIFVPSLLGPFPTVYSEMMVPYKFCFLASTFSPELGVYRNLGIFREPGVFIVYLNLAILFELFSQKVNFKKVIVFLITILTTMSTAGYIVVAFLLLSYFLYGDNENTKQKRLLVFSVIVIALVAISQFGLDMFQEGVFGKLGYDNESTASRTRSFTTNITIWLSGISSCLFGIGYTFIEREYSNFVDLRYGGGSNTNTMFKILAVHGIFYFSIIYYFTLKFCRTYFKKVFIVAIVSIIMLQSNEDLIVSFITYLIPVYGYIRMSNYESLTN